MVSFYFTCKFAITKYHIIFVLTIRKNIMATKLISKQRAMQIARNYRMGFDTVICQFCYDGVVNKDLKKEYRNEIKMVFKSLWYDKDKERVLELYQYLMNKIKKAK